MRRHTLTNEAGRAADRDFHDAILRASHNAALLVLSASIGAAVHWTTRSSSAAANCRATPFPIMRV
jgi:DNA-binding FadR family transcriptional regulator